MHCSMRRARRHPSQAPCGESTSPKEDLWVLSQHAALLSGPAWEVRAIRPLADVPAPLLVPAWAQAWTYGAVGVDGKGRGPGAGAEGGGARGLELLWERSGRRPVPQLQRAPHALLPHPSARLHLPCACWCGVPGGGGGHRGGYVLVSPLPGPVQSLAAQPEADSAAGTGGRGRI